MHYNALVRISSHHKCTHLHKIILFSDYAQVVECLLRCGAEPRLVLGRRVGTALCALTTHTAHKHRSCTASIKLVRAVFTIQLIAMYMQSCFYHFSSPLHLPFLSLFQLRSLLECGGDILQPVRLYDGWEPGTVVDYAHEAFKQVCGVYHNT